MTQLKPTNLYAVIVPEDAGDFKVCNGPNYWVSWLHNYEITKLGNSLAEFGPLIEMPKGNYAILGTVIKDDISFDFEQYLFSDKAEGMFYKYGNGSYDLKDRQNAFCHLLKENGLHFENTEINPKSYLHSEELYPFPSPLAHDMIKKWNEAEKNLVKKVLILKPL